MDTKFILDLQTSCNFLKELTLNPNAFYSEHQREKMRFGRPQKNKDHSIRMRTIFKPIGRLKIKQQKINQYIQTIELPLSMFGGVRGRNNILNALEHMESRFFLTVDLKDFFTNITNKQVYQTLISYNIPWKEARILTKLTTFKGSLPQGAPSSTALANLVFSSTALALERFSANHGITFTSFIDDLTFSAKKDFKHLTPQIIALIKQNGFFLNQKKIHYTRNVGKITGLIVKKNKISLEKEMSLNLENPRIKAYADSVFKYYSQYEKAKNS